MKELLYIIRKSGISKWYLKLCLILSVVSSLLAVIPTLFLGFVISSLSGEEINTSIKFLLRIFNFYHLDNRYDLAILGIVLFLFFSVISIIFRNVFCFVASIISDKIIISIRKQLFTKILKLKFVKYIGIKKGDFIHVVMNDTQRLEYIFSSPFYTLFSDLFDLAWIAIFILLIDPIILLILILTVPILYFASIKTAKVQKQVVKEIQEIDAILTSKVEQTLSGYETIKAFNGEEYEEKIFYNKSEDSFKYRKKGAKSLAVFYPVEGVLRVIGTSIILLYAIYKIKVGNMTIGMITILFQYTSRFYSPIRNITQYYQTIQAGIVSIQRISDIFKIEEEHNISLSGCESYNNEDEKIIFKNLSIAINDKNIFSDFSFECSRGDLVLIKGASGSGKTSLLRVFLGFYPIKNDQVYILGRDINSFNKKSLRKQIAYASQNIFLHNDSILNNIIYPNEQGNTRKDELECILKKLNLGTKNVDDMVDEDGKSLSGGEKVRIGFARAIAKGADIMILDEITSGIDSKTENLIIDILNKMKGYKTIFLVTHSNNQRLVKLADKVVNFGEIINQERRENNI